MGRLKQNGEDKMATDSQKIAILKKLSPTLRRYYGILLEHKTTTPAGLVLVRMPANTLKVRVREFAALLEARDALEELAKHGVIRGKHPWDAVELTLESQVIAQKEPAPKRPPAPVPSFTAEKPSAVASRPAPTKAPPVPRAVRRPATPMATVPQTPAPNPAPQKPVATKAIELTPAPLSNPPPPVAPVAARQAPKRAAKNRAPVRGRGKSPAKKRIHRQPPTPPREYDMRSMTVGQYFKEITDRVATINRIEFTNLPAKMVFDMMLKAKRVSLDDLCDLIEDYESAK